MATTGNIEIKSRQNVISFMDEHKALNMDIVKSEKKYEDEENLNKFFFSLDNKENTKGAVSRSLAKDITAGKNLDLTELTVGETIKEGQTEPVYLLMKRGEGNCVKRFTVGR